MERARLLAALGCMLLLPLSGCASFTPKDKLDVIALADGQVGTRDVTVSIDDPSAAHVLVLLSNAEMRWKLVLGEKTRVKEVAFYAHNQRRGNSVVTGMPEGLVPVEVRLRMPLTRFEERYGEIREAESFGALRAQLRERYGLEISTFQSGVSQAAFMIR